MSSFFEGRKTCVAADVVKLFSGFSFKSSDAQTSGVRWLKIANVGVGQIKWDAESYLPEEYVEEHKRYLTSKGDVVVAMTRPTLGNRLKIAKLEDDRDVSLLNQRVAKVITEEGVSLEYMYQFLSWEQVAREINKSLLGTDPPNLSSSVLKEIKLLLPPLPEQKRIAAILSSVDEAIAATEAVIEQTQCVKEGLLQDLLTRGIGHTRFKQTEIGEIPEGWSCCQIKELVSSIVGGVSVNSEDKRRTNGEIGVLKTSCVQNGRFSSAEHKVVLRGEIDRVKTPVVKDHLIFSRMNTPALVGACAYVEVTHDDLFLPDRLWLIATKKDLCSSKWLSYYLSSPVGKDCLSQCATGTSGSMKNISKQKLLSILVRLPSVSEQKRIVAILSRLDDIIYENEAKLEQGRRVKEGLMQDLLSGDVRVAVQ